MNTLNIPAYEFHLGSPSVTPQGVGSIHTKSQFLFTATRLSITAYESHCLLLRHGILVSVHSYQPQHHGCEEARGQDRRGPDRMRNRGRARASDAAVGGAFGDDGKRIGADQYRNVLYE